MEAKTNDLKSFHYLENGEISFSQYETIKSTKQLDSGIYNICCIQTYQGSRMELTKNLDAETIKYKSFPCKTELDKLFDSFFKKETMKRFADCGLYHKTGIIMYGKEGTGKTAIIKYYTNQFVNDLNALVFYITDDYKLKEVFSFFHSIRNIQDNPIIIIGDEFDHLSVNDEALWKIMLDGPLSINHSVVFAATNYIDKIPKALKDRPSRFKYCFEIGGIDKRDDIVTVMHPLLKGDYTTEEIIKFADENIGNTLDVIKHYCLDKLMSIETVKKQETKIGFKPN